MWQFRLGGILFLRVDSCTWVFVLNRKDIVLSSIYTHDKRNNDDMYLVMLVWSFLKTKYFCFANKQMSKHTPTVSIEAEYIILTNHIECCCTAKKMQNLIKNKVLNLINAINAVSHFGFWVQSVLFWIWSS